MLSQVDNIPLWTEKLPLVLILHLQVSRFLFTLHHLDLILHLQSPCVLCDSRAPYRLHFDTQFLTKVQGMPKHIKGAIKKIIRDFIWDNDTHLTRSEITCTSRCMRGG